MHMFHDALVSFAERRVIHMDWQEFQDEFPIKLNEQQQEAIKTINGPVLLLAVPGSGKTTVLVARLGYMILCNNIMPEDVLTVTYTVAATRDMSERFASFFGDELANRLQFKTINAVCAGIVNYYTRAREADPFELVSDEKMIMGVLAHIYQDVVQEYPADSDLKAVRTLISYIKNMMLTDEEIVRLDAENGIEISKMYSKYQEWMKKNNYIDFDDQLVYAYKLLSDNPWLLEKYQRRYQYICVDEAQDTSRIQHVIIALLASKTENLFMVGDEDQSIYGFRAAYPQALLEFEKDHAGAKVLFMEDNFRSNANIVIAADRFIQSNTLRHKKQMRATRAGTCIVEEIRVNSRLEQYENLVKVAENCRIQTAILYRDNDSSIPLVDLLDRAGIDYKMRNAELLFFKNRVVQDIVSIIKLALNSRDTDSFMSIYYKVGTFLRKVDASNICEKSIREEKTVFDAAMSCGLGGGRIGRINKLRAGLKKLKEDTVNDALDRILNEMGYGSYLKKAEIGTSKIEILRILGNRLDSVEQLISRLSELEEIIKNKKNNFDCPLILSTIHSSKGLEYDTVYMIDVVDGILPERSGNSLKNVTKEELEGYEEERRIFYVGITRAKNKLILYNLGRGVSFCDELLGRKKAPVVTVVSKQEKLLCETGKKGAEYKNRTAKKSLEMDGSVSAKIIPDNKYIGRKEKPYKARAFGKNYYKTSDNTSSGNYKKLHFEVGDKVVHKKYGNGEVVSVVGDKVKIRYGDTEKIMSIIALSHMNVLEIKK